MTWTKAFGFVQKNLFNMFNETYRDSLTEYQKEKGKNNFGPF